MEVVTEDAGSAVIVRISGSVDSLTAEALLSALHTQVEAGKTRLVGDLSGVDYTSSAGLRALLATLKATRQQGGDLRLAAVQPGVRKVLDLSGFTGILKIYDDVDAAVESFSQ